MSLIELTIVILILGILSAVASPRLGDSVRGSRLRAAANQIASHVDYVRRVAINEGRTTTLIIDPSHDRLFSTDVDFADRLGSLIDLRVKLSFDSKFELSANFDSTSSITFDFEGIPRVGTAAMQSGVISIGYDDLAYDIVIVPGLGTTKVIKRVVVGIPPASTYPGGP